MKIEIGSVLTFAHEVVGESGIIRFTKGQKVIVERFAYTGGYYGKMSHKYYPKKISGVKLADHEGIWFPSNFVELINQ